MAQTQPLWRLGFDLIERTAAKRIDELVDSEGFAVTAGLGRRAQREIAQRIERASRQVLHVLNLPAGSDVRRLLHQIVSVEREVRDLRKELAEALPLDAPASSLSVIKG